jgi:uncharacterized membrane protein HdeD (DUF308 family)
LVRRFFIGVRRKWPLLLAMGVVWMVVGSIIAMNVPAPYSLVILFVVSVWLVGHAYIVIRDASR